MIKCTKNDIQNNQLISNNVTNWYFCYFILCNSLFYLLIHSFLSVFFFWHIYFWVYFCTLVSLSDHTHIKSAYLRQQSSAGAWYNHSSLCIWEQIKLFSLTETYFHHSLIKLTKMSERPFNRNSTSSQWTRFWTETRPPAKCGGNLFLFNPADKPTNWWRENLSSVNEHINKSV